MNELIERLQSRAFNMGTRHVVYDELTVNLLKEAADTLLALQTQLAAAEVKAKEWTDVAYEAASQKEELKGELERVERETIRLCAQIAFDKQMDDDRSEWTEGWNDACSEIVNMISALPSAKTAQTTETE